MKTTNQLIHYQSTLGRCVTICFLCSIIAGCANRPDCRSKIGRVQVGTNVVFDLGMYVKELEILERDREQAKATVQSRLRLINQDDKSIFQRAVNARESNLATKRYEEEFCRFKSASEKNLRAIKAETEVYRRFLSIDFK